MAPWKQLILVMAMDGWTDGCHECHNATELCRRREAIVAVLPFSPCFRPNFIHQSIMPSLSTFTPLIPCPPSYTPPSPSHSYHSHYHAISIFRFSSIYLSHTITPTHHTTAITFHHLFPLPHQHHIPIPSHHISPFIHQLINSYPTYRLQYLSFLHLITFILVYPTLLYPTLFYSTIYRLFPLSSS